MSRYFKVKTFSKWAKNIGCTDEQLVVAINEMKRGLIDANLGSNLYKKRLSSKGKGKSGGYRVLIAMRINQNWFFLLGFSKSSQENISKTELLALRILSNTYLDMTDNELSALVEIGRLDELHGVTDEQ